MKRSTVAAILFLAALSSACESGLDRRYLEAGVGEPLELPPDLDEDQSRSLFELPQSFSGDDPEARDRIPVLARVESLRLEGSGDFYWLTVEEPVDNLYQLVKNFWAAEGYRLIKDEPVIGIMQTEWVFHDQGVEQEGIGNFFDRLFGQDDLSATQDQFRTRIERGEDGRNRIYIAHRGTEYRYVADTNQRAQTVTSQTGSASEEDDNLWRYRQPEPEMEIEMLSRLMVFLGLEQDQIDQQMANAKLFEPRAFMQLDAEEGSPFLIIKDPYQIAWNRVYHSLERLNFEITTAEFKSGLAFGQEGVIVITTEVTEEDKEGGFFSLFSASEVRERQIVLVLSEESHELTRMIIETEKGEFDTSPEGAEFLSLLHQQLR